MKFPPSEIRFTLGQGHATPPSRPSRPRSHSCRADPRTCMHPLGFGGACNLEVAGTNFWAVATSHCLIGQCSEQETDYCCLMRRLQRHSVGPRYMWCTCCLTWSWPVWAMQNLRRFFYHYPPRAFSHLSRLARSHECAWACHLYSPTNSAHSSGLTGAR